MFSLKRITIHTNTLISKVINHKFPRIPTYWILLYWNFRGLKITLTNNQFEVAYGIFNHKRIPLNNITSCDITKARFRTYGGVGIRFGVDGSWVYNTGFGEAVKLTFQSGRLFVFSTRKPQEIGTLINDLVNY
ncbi:MAG: hypothetical protein V3V33_10080 [Candidatus Lokiarchaeia archaeon]